MKTKSTLTRANIHNLTTLWETASKPFKSLQKNTIFSYCEIRQTDWPNRLWLNPNADIVPDTVIQARNIIYEASSKLALVYWDIFGSSSWQAIENEGFQKSYELMGMSLKLGKLFGHQNRIEVRKVETPKDAVLWEEIYPRAFGYRIGRNVLLNTFREISYYLAVYKNHPAGTAIVFHTGEITGIHGVGVVPEMRGQGIAAEMMKFILDQSSQSGQNHAVLQASKMGKGMYMKLGFEELFTMKSYHLISVRK